MTIAGIDLLSFIYGIMSFLGYLVSIQGLNSEYGLLKIIVILFLLLNIMNLVAKIRMVIRCKGCNINNKKCNICDNVNMEYSEFKINSTKKQDILFVIFFNLIDLIIKTLLITINAMPKLLGIIILAISIVNSIKLFWEELNKTQS